MVEDLLDLTPDEYIVKAYEGRGEKINKNNVSKEIAEKIKDKKADELGDYFQDLFKDVATIKFTAYGKDLADVNKVVVLESMDQLWTDHLESMQDLREGIGLRGYAQRDPLVEYKNEAFRAFERFINTVNSRVARRILKMVRVDKTSEDASLTINTNEDQISDVLTGSREMVAKLNDTMNQVANKKAGGSSMKKVIAAADDQFKNVGRNDLCPCGSGKKFKKCHGKNT